MNKHADDKKTLDEHLDDRIILDDRLADVSQLLRQKIAQIRAYMMDPNRYINDYVTLDNDTDLQTNMSPVNIRARERTMAEHCSKHGVSEGTDDDGNSFGKRYPAPQGVGTHLSHLDGNDLSAFLDRWKEYDGAADEAGAEHGTRIGQFITSTADFKTVWDRELLDPQAPDPRD